MAQSPTAIRAALTEELIDDIQSIVEQHIRGPVNPRETVHAIAEKWGPHLYVPEDGEAVDKDSMLKHTRRHLKDAIVFGKAEEAKSWLEIHDKLAGIHR